MNFKNGSDKIDLKAFNFASKADALSNFYEVGTANDDKVAFFISGTVVEINGIDMGQLANSGIIIYPQSPSGTPHPDPLPQRGGIRGWGDIELNHPGPDPG